MNTLPASKSPFVERLFLSLVLLAGPAASSVSAQQARTTNDPKTQVPAAEQRIYGPQPAVPQTKSPASSVNSEPSSQANQAGGRAPIIVGPNDANVQPAPPKPPFTLTPEQQQRLDQILTYWELTSSKVKTFDCRFKRWQYRETFAVTTNTNNPHKLWSVSEGTLRYAAPDKGEFKTVKTERFLVPEGSPPGTPPKLTEVDANDHWICDGDSVYSLYPEQKRMEQAKLPAEMKGKKIADGPLPFMFGAEKEKLLQRYWIRELKPPQDRKDEYWLEVRPKFAGDAMNFQQVTIILDKAMFLPIGMNVHLAEHREGNVARDAYEFFERSDNSLRHKTQQFFGSFIAPDLPRGWKLEVLDDNPPVGTANGPTAPTTDRPVPRAQR